LVSDVLVAQPSFKASSSLVFVIRLYLNCTYLHDHVCILFISSYVTITIVRILLGGDLFYLHCFVIYEHTGSGNCKLPTIHTLEHRLKQNSQFYINCYTLKEVKTSPQMNSYESDHGIFNVKCSSNFTTYIILSTRYREQWAKLNKMDLYNGIKGQNIIFKSR
jgi:hypothetical protein